MPERRLPEFTKEERAKLKDIAKELRHSRPFRLVANVFYAALMVYYLSTTEEGRRYLTNPEFRKMLIDREKRTGLLEDTIISPSLYHPNEEGTSLTKSDAKNAAWWVAYDFRRPSEFDRKNVRQIDQGRLGAFPLPEIIDNSPETYTPTQLLNIFDVSDVLYIELPTISELIDYGLVRETTYEAAYKEVGMFQKYSKLLALRNLNQEKVYQVTPKGNGLVFLASDLGEKRKQENKIKELVPAFPI